MIHKKTDHNLFLNGSINIFKLNNKKFIIYSILMTDIQKTYLDEPEYADKLSEYYKDFNNQFSKKKSQTDDLFFMAPNLGICKLNQSNECEELVIPINIDIKKYYLNIKQSLLYSKISKEFKLLRSNILKNIAKKIEVDSEIQVRYNIYLQIITDFI